MRKPWLLDPVRVWWQALTVQEARRVMERRATTVETRRIQSERAARTWWKSLNATRRQAIYDAEVPRG